MNILEQKIAEKKNFIIDNLREHLADAPVGVALFSDGNLGMFSYYSVYEVAELNEPSAILMLCCCDSSKSPEKHYYDILARARKIDMMTHDTMCKVLSMMGK